MSNLHYDDMVINITDQIQSRIDELTNSYNLETTVCNELATELINDPSLQSIYDARIVIRDRLNADIATLTTNKTTLENTAADVSSSAKTKYDTLVDAGYTMPPYINIKDGLITKIENCEECSGFCNTTKQIVIQNLLNNYNPSNY